MTNRRGGKPGPRSPSASADATPETTQDRGGRDVFSQTVFPTRGLGVSDPVTYTAALPVAEGTVQFVSGLLAAERRRRGTRGRRRALGCYRQAVLVLRWFLDGTRLAQLAADHRIGRSTAYRYLHEVIAAPDGWPIWTSPVRPGREHDTTALRAHAEALPLLTEWTDGTHAVLADLGYEGERAALTTPIKKITNAPLT